MKIPDLPDLYNLPETVLKYIQYLKDMLKVYKYDDLTKLPMRRDFNDTLDTYSLSGYPFTLYLVDLNGLKAMNDNGCYEDGDNLILKVVNELNNKDGRLFRIGGDEFSLLTYRDQNVPLISTHEYCVGRCDFEATKSAREYFKVAEKHLKQEKLKYYEEQGICRRK